MQSWVKRVCRTVSFHFSCNHSPNSLWPASIRTWLISCKTQNLHDGKPWSSMNSCNNVNSGRNSNPFLSLRRETETQANRKDSQEYNKCQTSISFGIQKNKSSYKGSGWLNTDIEITINNQHHKCYYRCTPWSKKLTLQAYCFHPSIPFVWYLALSPECDISLEHTYLIWHRK